MGHICGFKQTAIDNRTPVKMGIPPLPHDFVLNYIINSFDSWIYISANQENIEISHNVSDQLSKFVLKYLDSNPSFSQLSCPSWLSCSSWAVTTPRVGKYYKKLTVFTVTSFTNIL